MNLMGWTVVEPLSPGIFQIDPSIYDDVEYSAETRVFNVPIVGQGIKQIIKALTKKLSAKVSAQVTEQVTKQVGKAVTEKAGTKNAIEQASKDAIPEAFEKVMREKNPAYMKWLDEGMEGTRPALKVSGDSLDNAIAKEAADTATKKVVAKETGEEVIEEGGEQAVKEGTETLTARQAAIKDSVDSLAQKGTFYSIAGFTAFAILSPITGAFGEGVDDLIDAITGADCDDKDTEEEQEECFQRAQDKLLLFGAASVGLIGLFGALIITRLIPKAKTDTDGDGVPDDMEE